MNTVIPAHHRQHAPLHAGDRHYRNPDILLPRQGRRFVRIRVTRITLIIRREVSEFMYPVHPDEVYRQDSQNAG